MDAVTAWAEQRLAEQGIGRTGETMLDRARPWSTTWRIPTELGDVWLKGCGPGGRYEAGLTALLARIAPEWSLQPLAVDVQRGYLLLPDGGPDLGSVLATAEADVVTARWSDLVTEYAALQRRMVDHVPDLLAAAVPDLRAEAAPEVLRTLVEERAPEPLRARLRASAGRLDDAFARLASSAVPVSLEHADLHAGAALCGDDGQGPPAFFDWGDAMVSHPFASLVVTRRVLAMTLQVPESDTAVARVTEAYLETWTDLAPLTELRGELDDALLLGRLGRAWAWQRALVTVEPGNDEQFGDPVGDWLAELV